MYQFSMFDNEPVSAYVLSDGSIVESSVIEKAKSNINSNALDIDSDTFGEAYRAGLVYKPPFSFTKLKSFALENPYHSTAIRTIANDAFKDFEIMHITKKYNNKPEPLKKLSRSDKLLYEFFESCCDDFIELCTKIAIDYQTYNFAVVEVIRNKSGVPVKLNHVNAETCRIAKKLSDDINTDSKFIVQVVNEKERIFKIFDEDGPPRMREPNTGNIMTEMLYITGYDPNGGRYGIPNWLPALKALVGMDKVAEYNITFFNNEAVPRFAVLLQGGKLDEATKQVIKSYFKNDLKGSANAHKTLVLSTPKGAEIKLVPLAVEMRDGSFKFYRKDCRDEILSAHGVPPHRVQVLDSGSSGGLSPGTVLALDKAYKYSVIIPLQRKLASMFNKLIRYGFEIKDRVITFSDLDIGEEKEKAEVRKIIASAHEKYYTTGILTVDEIRKELHYDTYEELFEGSDMYEEIKEWSTTPRPIYLLKQANAQAQAEGLNTQILGEGINEVSNEYDDKSKQQTNRTQEDSMLNNLMFSEGDSDDE